MSEVVEYDEARVILAETDTDVFTHGLTSNQYCDQYFKVGYFREILAE